MSFWGEKRKEVRKWGEPKIDFLPARMKLKERSDSHLLKGNSSEGQFEIENNESA